MEPGIAKIKKWIDGGKKPIKLDNVEKNELIDSLLAKHTDNKDICSFEDWTLGSYRIRRLFTRNIYYTFDTLNNVVFYSETLLTKKKQEIKI